jgi:hypothetical protein
VREAREDPDGRAALLEEEEWFILGECRCPSSNRDICEPQVIKKTTVKWLVKESAHSMKTVST